jgi:glyoxylase-like metal-dependent hydrolase (beta-lactamase superfamily II)
MLPLAVRGLPPSTHTNAYLIGGDVCYLLDPAAIEPDEQRRLFDAVDANISQGGRRTLAGVVVSHHHPDHIASVVVCAERYRAPVLAHARTAKLLAGKVKVDRFLNDGDRLDLGRTPHGGRWHLETILTPGHAPGHLVFYEPSYRLLFAGDMVSTLSSVVIAPPEGDLTLYLESLERLQKLPCRLLLPAHGPATAQPARTLADAVEHRAAREEQLVQALGRTPRALAELTRDLYRGLPPNLMPLAELQTMAGLEKLRREGKAQSVEAGWVGTPIS